MKTIIAFLLGFFSLFSYCSKKTVNPVTGQKQYVSITPKQEIAIGLNSLNEMSRKYGGMGTDVKSEEIVDRVGFKIVKASEASKTPYKFDFHVLNDNRTINAFALPGGQVFITKALLRKLKTEGQIAGVLGHEIGHVVARHGAQHIAKQQLTNGLVGAVGIGVYDPKHPNTRYVEGIARITGELVNMKFGRNDELESDTLGLKFMSEAGYDPRAMIKVMEILEEASKGNVSPEFFSTHPNPENRIGKIDKAIKKLYPKGIPQGLEN